MEHWVQIKTRNVFTHYSTNLLGETGVQRISNPSKILDAGFRRNDDYEPFSTFYDFIIIPLFILDVVDGLSDLERHGRSRITSGAAGP